MGLSASSPTTIFGPLVPLGPNSRPGQSPSSGSATDGSRQPQEPFFRENQFDPADNPFTPNPTGNDTDFSKSFENPFFTRPSDIFQANKRPGISNLSAGGSTGGGGTGDDGSDFTGSAGTNSASANTTNNFSALG